MAAADDYEPSVDVEGIGKQLVLEWKSGHMTMFAPVLFHTCTKTCQLAELSLFRCSISPSGICLGGGMFPTFETRGVSRTISRRLTFLRQPCWGQKHETVEYPQAWGCLFSGNIHWCARDCLQSEEDTSGDKICLLTGRVQRDLVFRNQKEKAPTGAVYNDTRKSADYKAEYMNLSTSNMSLAEYHAFLASGIRKKSGRHIREQFFTNCIIFANEFLTVRIAACGLPDYQEREREVTEAINRCWQAGVRSFVELVEVAAVTRHRRPPPFAIRMSKACIRKHASLLATRIVVLIGLMRQKVPRAKEYMKKLSLKEVFIAGLELCRTGISLGGVVYLTADPILSSIPVL